MNLEQSGRFSLLSLPSYLHQALWSWDRKKKKENNLSFFLTVCEVPLPYLCVIITAQWTVIDCFG